MNEDDDLIARTLTERPLSAEDEAAISRVQTAVSHHDFAVARRFDPAIELLVAGIVAVVVVTFILAITRNAHPVVSPTHTPVASATAGVPTASPVPSPVPNVPLRISQQLNLGKQTVNALSVSPGVVWVAVQGASYGDAGKLLRIDAASARQSASWAIGGDPTAIAAAGAYVWVANSFGDGSQRLPEQNTVMQFNAETGAVVHIYRVTDPRALVANSDSVLVVSAATANGPTVIQLLSGGQSSPVATVSGTLEGPWVSSQSALAVCANEVYLAITSVTPTGPNLSIYSVPQTGGQVRPLLSLPNNPLPSLACDDVSQFVAKDNGTDGGIVRVNLSAGSVIGVSWFGPNPDALTFGGGRLWVLQGSWVLQRSGGKQTAPSVTSLDPIGRSGPATLTLPTPVSYQSFLLAYGGSGVWAVAGNGNLLLHIVPG